MPMNIKHAINVMVFQFVREFCRSTGREQVETVGKNTGIRFLAFADQGAEQIGCSLRSHILTGCFRPREWDSLEFELPEGHKMRNSKKFAGEGQIGPCTLPL